MNPWIVAGDVHIAAAMIDHGHFMPTLLTSLDQAAGRIKVGVS